MHRSRWHLILLSLSVLGCQMAFSQAVPATGSLTVNGRVKIGTKQVPLKRKRFYLFRGGLDANKDLIARLKAAKFTSRDCFYCQVHASPEFIGWLKAGDCESVHCREITADDIAKVPEFQAAFQKGKMSATFAKKPVLEQKWLVTNLEAGVRSGWYDARKANIADLLKGLTPPLQSSMTDNAGGGANFRNIPLAAAKEGATEKFLVSDLVPIEVGDKSYLWACEVEIGSTSTLKKTLDAPDASKLVKKCEVIVNDLPVCKAGTCEKK